MHQPTHPCATVLSTVLQRIYDIGAPRPLPGLKRRLFKLGEELGEVTEAYLAITSGNNYKNLTIADVREEAVDVFIVAVDIFFTIRSLHPVRADGCPMELAIAELVTEMPSLQGGVCDNPEAFEPYLADLFGKHGQLMESFVSRGATQEITSTYFDTISRLAVYASLLVWTRIIGDEATSDAEHLSLVSVELNRKLDKWARLRQPPKLDTQAPFVAFP